MAKLLSASHLVFLPPGGCLLVCDGGPQAADQSRGGALAILRLLYLAAGSLVLLLHPLQLMLRKGTTMSTACPMAALGI